MRVENGTRGSSQRVLGCHIKATGLDIKNDNEPIEEF